MSHLVRERMTNPQNTLTAVVKLVQDSNKSDRESVQSGLQNVTLPFKTMPFICMCCLAFVCVEQVDCSGAAYEFHLRRLLCWRNLSEPSAVWYNPCRAAPASAAITHTYSHKPRVTPDLSCAASEEMGGVMRLAHRPFVPHVNTVTGFNEILKQGCEFEREASGRVLAGTAVQPGVQTH